MTNICTQLQSDGLNQVPWLTNHEIHVDNHIGVTEVISVTVVLVINRVFKLMFMVEEMMT